jgi:hypothetical protein
MVRPGLGEPRSQDNNAAVSLPQSLPELGILMILFLLPIQLIQPMAYKRGPGLSSLDPSSLPALSFLFFPTIKKEYSA